MLDRILQVYNESDYDFRTIANQTDPLAHKFNTWVDYYRLKWAITKVLKPHSILEIGVRYGYSAHAFLSGAPDSQYVGIDLDCEMAGGVKGAINWAREILQTFNTKLLVEDSQSMDEFPGGAYDLIHVDGQQDGDSSFHDLELAIKQGTYVLVDGYHWTNLNFAAVNDFLLQHRNQLEWYAAIPGYAGELLIKPKSATALSAINVGTNGNQVKSTDLTSTYDTTYYTESCGGYDSFQRHNGQRLEDERLMSAATLACLKPQGSVLDLGCGRGELAFYFAQQGYRVTAIDYSADAIELAKGCFKDHPDLLARVDFHCADVNQIELDNNHYDLAIATDLIEHMHPEEVAKLYHHVNQWLKPDGLFIVHTFPNRWYYDYDYKRKRRMAKRLGAYLTKEPRTNYELLMHINEQSPRVLKKQLRDTFAHSKMWFAAPQDLAGSLIKSMGHRELAAAPSLYAIASAQSLPETQLLQLLTSQPIPEFTQPQIQAQIQIQLLNSPNRVQAGASFELQAILKNDSVHTLHSYGDYPIHWGYRWLTSAGNIINENEPRTRIFPPAFSQHHAPAQARSQTIAPSYINVTAPKEPGEYSLRLTLVQEHVHWFDNAPTDISAACTITVE